MPEVITNFSYLARSLQTTICVLMLWLLAFPTLALSPQQEVQQLLSSFGLQRFFASVDALAEREIQRNVAAGDQSPELDDLRQRWVAADLQARLEVLLLQQYDPTLYHKAMDILSRQALAPVIQSCHGQALEDYSSQLTAYQQQLQRQPARPNRVSLAQQLDSAARTSRLASQLHSRVEQQVYLANRGEGAPDVPWQEVVAEREAVLQEAVVTWYLYCGRYFQDELLQALIDSYRQPAVQQWLDQYQAALDKVLPPAIIN